MATRAGKRAKLPLGPLAVLLAVAFVAPISWAGASTAGPRAKFWMGDKGTGRRDQPAHVISLRDPEGDTIQPNDRLPLPFSTRQTCGADCHDVSVISRGWHFDAGLPGVDCGRSGQPWLFVDRESLTQIPLSYRSWPGTYRPEQLGMSRREFALRFAGRMPGGLSGDGTRDRVERARWTASGDLEVNCLACHDASPAYDQSEYAKQVALENFRYAPAAASGMSLVTGSVKDMPDFFDYLLPLSVEDGLQARVPRVAYAANRFLPGEKIAFDVVREAKVSRCYYCHSNADIGQTGAARWKGGEDVHTARGIACVQCHRNGLDHMMIRGYEGEPAAARDSYAAEFTCRGCHMGQDSNASPASAKMGAPYPRHAGIPPLHFEKLTCTACHSGPWPTGDTHQLKTSLSHGLGEHNVNAAPGVLPHIYYPVFATQPDGKIGINRLVWPAFWGTLREGSVEPMRLTEISGALARSRLKPELAADGNWPEVTDAWLTKVLRLLEEEAGPGEKPVYIAGGKLHRLTSNGSVAAETHAQAQPYLWPLAHDVRPASQGLGARGCQDCHSTEAAIFFGNVAVDSPLIDERVAFRKMGSFENKLDLAYNARLAHYWKYRSWLKGISIGVASLLFLLLCGYTVKAFDRLSART